MRVFVRVLLERLLPETCSQEEFFSAGPTGAAALRARQAAALTVAIRR